jgi:tetratricopeptide (TPR) repeat protein
MTWRIDKAKRIAKLKGHGGPVRCLALNSDGGIAISGSDDLSAMIWSVERQRRVKLLTGHFVSVTSAAINFDNTRAATGSADWALRVWDVDTAKPVFKLESERDSVTALAFQPGTFEILAGYSSGALRLYDAQSGSLIQTLGGDDTSVDTRCPSCAKLFAVPKEFIGKKGLCPYCRSAFAAGEYSPDKSYDVLVRAKALFSSGKKADALALFDEAIRIQGDNHEAILHAIICRNHVSADVQQAGKHAEAVKMLDKALRLFASDKTWPTGLYANARQQAYTAAFLAAKACRYDLFDIPMAITYLKYAQQLNNTLDVQDMLSHLSGTAGDTAKTS